MSKRLSQWQPSETALELIRLNGVSDEHIGKAIEYLKSRDELDNIEDIEGYDNWDAFFIMFCIKANK